MKSVGYIVAGLVAVAGFVCGANGAEPARQPKPDGSVFRAGAAAVDITPTEFPVLVNGYFNSRSADRAVDRLHARALVLDDGRTRLALVVVDSLMMPRDLLDQAKDLAHKATGIPTEQMLISATHTHSAPSAMGCLGTDADPNYPSLLVRQIARSIQLAEKNLEPARAGWMVVQDHEHTHCRRWIRRPDRMLVDPFGQQSVRAHMHPGHMSPDAIGPSGPDEPDLSILSVQSTEGRPLAVLANYAMHYYGTPALSSDFCGRFGDELAKLIGATAVDPPFVGMMSQGTSGDNTWRDYGKPAHEPGLEGYTKAVASIVRDACQKIEYHDRVPLAMGEAKLRLGRRVPNAERLAWAKKVVAEMKGSIPGTMQEIYAREQILLHEDPSAELILQAIRIGELGITAIPNEVYAITGLKIKAQSPLQPTMNIELAGGAEGYIPPPEQFKLGGYTTWEARTAGLEVEAEPKIVETLLVLLEKVAGRPRQELVETHGRYARAILDSTPHAYWRLGEIAGRKAADAAGDNHGTYEDGIALYLPGPESKSFSGESTNRCVHFAGGRMKAAAGKLGPAYSVEMWFYNGLPADARPVTGYLFSQSEDRLGIGGIAAATGKLFFSSGGSRDPLLVGTTSIDVKTWYHIVLVRDGKKVQVYLNGNTKPEISGEVEIAVSKGGTLLVGGESEGAANFEGKIDEVAVYDRALTADEVALHHQAATAPEPDSQPQSATSSMNHLHVSDGFQVELVAAEPLVIDPVAIDWGADGKLWVVEMADYPLGMDGSGKPGGRVRWLQDTDGDGRYDRSTLFADGLNFPNGILTWRDGVLVTCAPDILYLEDRDGDGRADVRQKLFSGFVEANQQLRINGLRWGLDNWVYCANGSSGGSNGGAKVKSEATGRVVALGRRDFRLRADDGAFDPQSGPSQFGRDRDDWDNWFGCMNSYPLWHFALADHYTRRNPHVAAPDPIVQLVLPRNPKIYPVKPPEKRFHSFEQSGRFTSACSTMVYRDELLFGRGDEQHAFVCEPFHNLVHHEVLTDDGVSFTARRADAERESEFLASEDRWFRPVMVRTGPDGALWVVDMYRYMIEHPQWLPTEGQEELKPFYRSGDDQGRIYRIYAGGQRPRPIARLDKLSTQKLVEALDSPNGPQRDKAQQLLIWRNDPSAGKALEKLAAASDNPRARLHALCTLDGLGALSAERIERAMADVHPGVRRHAVRLAESRAHDAPQLIAAATKLIDDPDAKVRQQLAYTLGQWHGPVVGQALGRLALANVGDQYITAAVISSVSKENLEGMLDTVLAAGEDRASQAGLLGQLLALAAAFGSDQTLLDVLGRVAEPAGGRQYASWQYGTVAGMLDALERRGTTLASVASKISPPKGSAELERIDALIASARQTAMSPAASEADRVSALRLMARQIDGRADDVEALGQLLNPRTPSGVQSAVVAQLSRQKDRQTAEVLLAGWKSHVPALRRPILDVLVSRTEWLPVLLDKIESGHVSTADLDAATRQRLAGHKDPGIRRRVEKLVAGSTSADRQQVLGQYQSALDLQADRASGAEVFKKRCAACHKLGDVGHEVGPNLASLTDKSPNTLLVSILDPSRAVEAKYVNYLALTDDGRTHSGIVVSETGSSITLLGQESKQEVILRNELDELQSTGKSAMPDGLEKDISHQEMADLIAYLNRI